jgi:hypothetical protein
MIIGLNSSAFSQESGPNTVFWKITGEKIEKPSYLFGTIHIIPRSQFIVYDEADKRLKECEQLILEMEIDVPMKTQMEWARKLMLPEGQTIEDYMDDKSFSRIESYALDSLGIKKFLFNTYLKMKPFAFYSALIPHVIGKKIEGYDMHFSGIAKKEEIPVLGLESFDFQLGIFDSIPCEEQLEMFFSEEEDLDLQSELQEILDMYLSQDIYSMAESLSEEEADGYEEFESELLVKRNNNWVKQLDSLVREKSSFIAVGAAHLAGEYGLIGLLREKGYTVEPIMLIEN